MSVSPEVFEQMTPAEFLYAWTAWNRKEQCRVRNEWERERWSTWVLASIQLDRKDRRPMTEMFPLPWEQTTASPNQSELTMPERRERVADMLKSIKQN